MCAKVMWKIIALLPKGSVIPSWLREGAGLQGQGVSAEAAAVVISAASQKTVCSRETDFAGVRIVFSTLRKLKIHLNS